MKSDYYLYITFLSGIATILSGLYIRSIIVKKPCGTSKMIAIASYINEAAMAYLKRQYKVISLAAMIIFIILFAGFYSQKGLFFAVLICVCYLIGAFLSALAGFIGMNTSLKANVRTANAATKSLSEAFDIAIKGGGVTGLIVTGLALSGLSFVYFFVSKILPDKLDVIKILVGMAFGSSLISVFARLGGGIFTKAADIGADLVGKAEKNMPEDDPRNPGVIADNVGDNVGDCAGMAADLFETYLVTIVSSMLIGTIIFNDSRILIYPLLLAAISCFTTILGVFTVKLNKSEKIEKTLYATCAISAGLSIIGFYYLTKYLFFDDPLASLDSVYSFHSLFNASITGIIITILLILTTEYFTSKRFHPVKSIAKASISGHATNVITGLSVGMRATVLPVIVIASGIIFSYSSAGLYGVSIAAVTMLSIAGMIITLDAYGPIADNAGGISEMAGLDEEAQKVTDTLDAVGNTTKAVTKGYAIGSAGLAAIVLFSSFIQDLNQAVITQGQLLHHHVTDMIKMFSLADAYVVSGLFIGGLIPYLFSAYALDAVSRTATMVVLEIRKAFAKHPDILIGKEKPDYANITDMITKSALKEMLAPALLPVIFPVILLLLGKCLEIYMHKEFVAAKLIGGMLTGSIITGFFLAISMTFGGGAWDNAKKLIEEGFHGGKGSFAHQCAITGDTVGDPYKDTAGPAINPVIKVLNIVALLLVSFLV